MNDHEAFAIAVEEAKASYNTVLPTGRKQCKVVIID